MIQVDGEKMYISIIRLFRITIRSENFAWLLNRPNESKFKSCRPK